MLRRVPTFVLSSLLMVSELAWGQESTRGASRHEMVASGLLMLPQGEWRSADQPIAGGGGFHALFPVATTRVFTGFAVQGFAYDERRSHMEYIITAHGVLRIRLSSKPRRPFVEALGGLQGFSVEPQRLGTHSYGVGAGMQFPIATRPPFGTDDQEYLEIGMRYLRGGGAHLMTERVASSTNSLVLYVGWGLRLRRTR